MHSESTKSFLQGTLQFDDERWSEALSTSKSSGLGTDTGDQTLRFEERGGVQDGHWDLANLATAGALEVRRGEHRWWLGAGWAATRRAIRRTSPCVNTGALPLPDQGAHHIALSPDKKRMAVLVTQGWAVQVVLLDLETGEPLHTWGAREGDSMGRDKHIGRGEYTARVGFSADGSEVVCVGMDRHLRIWNTETGALRLKHRFERMVGAVALTPDILALTFRGKDETNIHLLDPFDPTSPLPESGRFRMTDARGLELQGRTLIAYDRYEARRFDLDSGDTTYLSQPVRGCRVVGDRLVGIVRGNDATDTIVALNGSETLWEVPLRIARHVALHGSHAYALGDAALLRIELDTGAHETVLEFTPSQLVDGDVLPDANTLWVGAGASVLRVNLEASALPPVAGAIQPSLSPDGRRLQLAASVRGSQDRHLALHDTATLEPMALLSGDPGAWSPDGSILALQHEQRIQYVDRDGNALGEVHLATSDTPYEIQIDGHVVATVLGEDVVVFDGATGLERWRQPGDKLVLGRGRVAVRRDGSWTVHGLDEDRTVEIGEEEPVFLADGAIALGEADQLRILNPDGSERWTRPWPWATITPSADPRFLLHDWRGELRLLDAATGDVLHAECPHPFRYTIACTPGGGVVSFGHDGVLCRVPDREEAEPSDLSSDLQDRLVAGHAAREAADRQPLERTDVVLSLEGHAALPGSTEGDGVRFELPRDEEPRHDDIDGDVLLRTDDRLWVMVYDDDSGEDKLVVRDGEGNLLGEDTISAQLELEIAASGRFAVARIDSFTRQRFSWHKLASEPEDIPDEMEEAAISLFVVDDAVNELGTIVPTTRGEYLEIRDLAFSEGLLVVEARHDEGSALEIWDLRTQKQLHIVQDPGEWCVVGDRLAVLSAGDDWGRILRLIDLRSGSLLAEHTFDEVREDVVAAGDALATTGGGRLILHDLNTAAPLQESEIPAREGALSADGTCWEERGKRWRLSDGTPLHDHATRVRRMSLDGDRLATLDGDGELIVRQLDGTVLLRTLLEGRAYDAWMTLVAGHVAWCVDSTLSVVELATGVVRTSGLQVTALASMDGDLFTLDDGGRLRRWDLESGEQTANLEVGVFEPQVLALRAGRALLIGEEGDYQTVARVWDLTEGSRLDEVALDGRAETASLSPSGERWVYEYDGVQVRTVGGETTLLHEEGRSGTFLDDDRVLLSTWDASRVVDLDGTTVNELDWPDRPEVAQVVGDRLLVAFDHMVEVRPLLPIR